MTYCPSWFIGLDILIELFATLILIFIAVYSFKLYKINDNKNNAMLSLSFVLMAISYIIKNFANASMYYWIQTVQPGFVAFNLQALGAHDNLILIAHLISRFLLMAGTYLLFSIHEKPSKTSEYLTLFLLMLLTFYTYASYYIYHLTTLILMALIIVKLSKRHPKDKNAKRFIIAFGLLALAQLVFIFNEINPACYVAAQAINLIGFILLLLTFMTVRRNAKKNKK